jgi:putative ABC transport system permease protein
MQIFLLIKEFIEDIKKQKLRAFLTTIAITWGTLAIILLMAFGTGLGFRMNESFLNAGDLVVRLYSGQTSIEFEGLPTGRRIRLSEEDAWLLDQSIPDIDIVHPGFGRGVHLRNGDKAAWTHMEGVYPQFELLRRMPPAPGGRFINKVDIEERRRVVFLGGDIAEEMFGDPNPVGEIVMLDGLPFTIIGTMPKKLQTSMNNGPDNRRAIIPFTTFRSIHGNRYVREILLHPRNPKNTKAIEQQIRNILGRKYQFDPTDERAIGIWNMVEAVKISGNVFLGLNIFLGVIGGMTLIIAGIGVANIMYVVAKERTKEIGVKRAIGAKKRHIIGQFVFESLLIAFSGGGFGLLISIGIVKAMWMIPISDEGAMQFLGRPMLSTTVIITSISILALIGLLAGLFPARKAANVDPVEALRYE